MVAADQKQAPLKGPRLGVVDLARTMALAGMALFHLVYDLVLFGHLPPETVQTGFWPLFARLVAGSFLFLAGVSLWLAQGPQRNIARFARRIGLVAGAAALISLGTYLAMPDRWIFFGILHSIAFASLVGLAVIRWPVGLVLGLAGGVVAMRVWGQADLFNAAGLQWTGLGTLRPSSVDFVPPFPWLAPFLCGLVAARVAGSAGLWRRLEGRPAGPVWHHIGWPGRHSLLVYLLHQPVLIGLVQGATWLWH